MNTEEFLRQMNNTIKTEGLTSTQEAVKQAIVTRVFIEVTSDLFFFMVKNHREILDAYLKERLPNAQVQEEDN